ncbi:hypothetical protein D9615_000436 [Tricholomella constricta]|uniref:Origin recognition complex subunit 4 n=1 Tax=Tricholomella constricta TaxID=117010 RepID=A0A8H5MC47_9AGAR|nr:hypothetical protein D9615_000436 [Tricholomella constricta]
MPPKRKASTALLRESPTKRLTRSTASSLETHTTENTALHPPNNSSSTTTPVTTPRRNLKTYGRRASTRRGNHSADSLKENEKQEEARETGEDSSEDELDMLSPDKPAARLTSSPALMDGSSHLSSSPPATRLKSARPPLDTPTRSKRGQVQLSPAKAKARAALPREINGDEEPTQNCSARVMRRSVAAANDTPQTTNSKPTPSPKNKKPLTVTKDNNIEQRAKRGKDSTESGKLASNARKSSSPRKQPRRAQGAIAESSKKKKITASQDAISTPSRVSIGRPPSPDSGRTSPSPATLEFASVVIPTRLPRALPCHLHACFNAQKRAILRALRNPPGIDDDDGNDDDVPSTNSIAAQQLTSLLNGTVCRGEGNSCLVLGPRGSGKSRLVEECISNVSGDNPLVLRLSGWTQHSDRLAMREIAYQLGQQTGTSYLADGTSLDVAAAEHDVEEANPFLDVPPSTTMSVPPSSHLPALISVLPTLGRPSIVVLDGFDLFALHPRQSLLYCLLDTAQSCRAAAGAKGLAIIGITSRIDTITMLEKRVKSRFSGRMLRTAPPCTVQSWEKIATAVLSSDITEVMEGHPEEEDVIAEWNGIWDAQVEQFLTDKSVQTVMNETFSVTRDVRMLSRILLSVVLRISPASASLSPSQFVSAALVQRARPRFSLLHTLPYPGICLLIASVHADTAGHARFTFEMLHEYFRDQVRASTSAPVQVNGGSIGMVRCSRQVLMTAFEDLIATKVFVPVAAFAPSEAKEFVKYRSVVDREDVKKAVDKMSQVNLKKWLTKAQ